ncbi:hypothetical protein PPL_00210 [Heterostelium album PN500]|uniref:Uncharacterized protein n=1 Tax=Heterostelium pallidum (strain ATCC 26659 / Pp 5 / PN500) TaxID=670386 RepID=D3AVU5_HETP5|nr:hypothetical protein PPL_00210 [Heterostelium album PN500]EFA86418.1 hypothetical protein PPL_00210 [Heterostelium album PN500]|eukprot:XP_020438523.1 hypothetical protein PPL_00210 [Heterostelium album PN500]
MKKIVFLLLLIIFTNLVYGTIKINDNQENDVKQPTVRESASKTKPNFLTDLLHGLGDVLGHLVNFKEHALNVNLGQTVDDLLKAVGRLLGNLTHNEGATLLTNELDTLDLLLNLEERIKAKEFEIELRKQLK